MQERPDLKTQLSTCISLQSDSGVYLIPCLGYLHPYVVQALGASSSDGWLVADAVSNHSVV